MPMSHEPPSTIHHPFRMPAEWEPHTATWIAWPHHEPDWPGKLAAIPWVYAEIVRAIADHELVEILCHTEAVLQSARAVLDAHAVRSYRVRLHVVPSDRVWLRDSAPTTVHNETGDVVLINWAFNGWAKYDNWQRDVTIGEAIARITRLPRIEPRRSHEGEGNTANHNLSAPGGSRSANRRPALLGRAAGRPDVAKAEGPRRIVLEGGGIDVNGRGLLLVTEEWLLSDVQVRNPGLTRDDYERLFGEWLGVRHTIWLGEGCVGDDTHGHVDDIARFVAPDAVVLAVEEDPADDNHRRSIDNLHRLTLAAGSPQIGPLRIVRLPFPRPVIMNGERLPASYANFYIANGLVLVPTFNDPNDRVALNILADLLPSHRVIGIHAVDLVWGLGTLHCLTQQQAAPITLNTR